MGQNNIMDKSAQIVFGEIYDFTKEHTGEDFDIIFSVRHNEEGFVVTAHLNDTPSDMEYPQV